MMRVQLFGNPAVQNDGQVVQVPRRKSRALIYYLAAQTAPVSREHLLALFWPDNPRTSAQQVLRTTLHSLRKTLGSAIDAEGDLLALNSAWQVDTKQFERLLASAELTLPVLRQVIELYRGDFLEGFSLPDSLEFEDWQTRERERYRRMAVRALTLVSKQHEDHQEYRPALVALDRALAFNPLQEDLQREAIRLEYLAGDRPGAIQRYDQLRRLLDDEMGVPPMLETRKLYDAIINDTYQPQTPISSPAPGPRPPARSQPAALNRLPFTGRTQELETLQKLAGTHQLVLIEGEPGIGKTRLAREFQRLSGGLSLTGTGYEMERTLPYHPIIEALRGLAARPDWKELQPRLQLAPIWQAEAARLAPELASGALAFTPVSADEARLWEGLHQFLWALARLQPVVLFIDDLHWADPSTLALLGHLTRQAAPGVMYLAAARPPQPRSALATLVQSLTRSERLVRLPLERLQPEDVSSIARDLAPTRPEPLAAWLVERSEGNPYFLSELARYARQSGLLLPHGDFNESSLEHENVVPSSVYNLIQARLSPLPEAARRVLDAAAAAGREFEFEVVARASGLSEPAALDGLDELIDAGLILLVPQNGEDSQRVMYTFDHSLTREVTRQEAGEARQSFLHRRVAEALEEVYHSRLPSVAGQIAFHFTEGGDPRRAAPYAYRAGEHAASLAAWNEAIKFFEQALLAETSPARQSEILTALGDARFRAGQLVQASDTFREALRLVEPGSVLADRLRLQLGQSFLLQARYAEAILLAQQVLQSGSPENAVEAEFLWGTALSLEGADLNEAAEHLNQAIGLGAGRIGPVLLADIKFELGSVAAQQGKLAEAIELYHQSQELVIDLGKQAPAGDMASDRLILSYNNLAYHLHLLDDPQAHHYARAGLDLAQEKGALGLQPYIYSTLGEIELKAGNLAGAQALFEQGLALAERISIPERIAGLTANLGLIAAQRGEKELAIHLLSTALARADSLGTLHLAAQIRVWLAPLLPLDQARQRLTEARAVADGSGRSRLLAEIQAVEQNLPPSA